MFFSLSTQPFLNYLIQFIWFLNLNKMIGLHLSNSTFLMCFKLWEPLIVVEHELLFAAPYIKYWNSIKIKFQSWYRPKNLIIIRVALLCPQLSNWPMLNCLSKNSPNEISCHRITNQETLCKEELVWEEANTVPESVILVATDVQWDDPCDQIWPCCH